MRRFNFLKAEPRADPDDPPAFAAKWAPITRVIGAQHLGGNLLEIGPGQHSAPYHWEAGQEEWLLVLSGCPTLRTPAGERELKTGDVVCFPAGPDGAHRLTNNTDQTVRFILLSDRRTPNIIFYPDSGKIGAWCGRSNHGGMFRAQTSVDYWDGE